MNIQKLEEAQKKLLKNPHDEKALSFLINQLNDRDSLYRVNAAAVLGDVGESVGEVIKDQAVPALGNLLEKGNEYDKRAAAEALAGFGKYAQAALPILRKNLSPSDRDVAWFSAEAIGKIGEPAAEAVPGLLQCIKENINGCDDYFSEFCAYFIPALGKIGPGAKSAIPDLEALLNNNRDPYTRMYLAVALIRIAPDNRRAFQTIEELLKNPDTDIRHRTLAALAECGNKAKPVKRLIEGATKDENEDVRRASFTSLKALNSN